MRYQFPVSWQLPEPWNPEDLRHEMIQTRMNQRQRRYCFFLIFHGGCLLREGNGIYCPYRRKVFLSMPLLVRLQFNPFIQFLNKLPELFISFDKVVDGPAGMQYRGMVLISAMQANVGKG
jgi:hypothetical protein